jgi:hypothetical protein
MRHPFTAALLLLTLSAASQPRMVTKAVIRFKTEVTFPENFGNNFGGGEGGGGGQMTMMSGGMEASSTMYVSGDMSKVESVSDFGNNIVITDHKARRTTTLVEAMGRKTGFYSTPEDEKIMRARMDSMRNARRDDPAREARRDSLQRAGFSFGQPSKPEIEYTTDTRKIAGLECRKAIIRTKNQRGDVTENIVWFSPDFRMPDGMGFASGQGGGGGARGGGMSAMMGVPGLDQLQGFPMEFQMERGNGFKSHTIVTKVQLDANIDDKAFEIPKGFDVKPMSEMQQGGRGGMMMMRMGSGGN